MAQMIDSELNEYDIRLTYKKRFYWSVAPGTFVMSTPAFIVRKGFDGTDSEWFETLIETINDAAEFHSPYLTAVNYPLTRFVLKCSERILSILRLTYAYALVDGRDLIRTYGYLFEVLQHDDPDCDEIVIFYESCDPADAVCVQVLDLN